ncbi:transcriptional regulator, LacI family [Burkholderia sp. GAS332]|nr:transcriptional regulator, LacI family [Burkholderia sp. GAS332]
MEDVARAAQVSMSTVSHVLNGTRKVSPTTVKAVRDAMQSVGYVPNTLAQALAGAASRTIGVAMSALTNHYFTETVRAIEAGCAKHGLLMFLADTHDDPDQELSVVQALHQRRVDGIVLAPTSDPESRTLKYLRLNRIPAVLVDRAVSDEFDQVGVENKNSSSELVTHLIRHGHRRIGLITGSPGVATTEERFAGYLAALEKAGLPFDQRLVRCGESSIDPAFHAAHELLKIESRPTAIMTANNLMTIGAMHALRDAGVEVPKDMALVGFDDFDWADYFNPRLTVMAQPLEDLGARAVELLMKRIKDPDGTVQSVHLAPSMRIRNSCGCPG